MHKGESPHRVLNRSIEWFDRARGMLAGMPYFKSRLVADATVTSQLDDAMKSIDYGLAKLLRLRDTLGWERGEQTDLPFPCPNCGSVHTFRCEQFATSSGFAAEPFYVCLECRFAFTSAGKARDKDGKPRDGR